MRKWLLCADLLKGYGGEATLVNMTWGKDSFHAGKHCGRPMDEPRVGFEDTVVSINCNHYTVRRFSIR